MSRDYSQSGAQLASRLINSAARGACQCVLVVMTLAATCAAPAVADVLLSEAESPLETDEEAGIEAASSGANRNVSHRFDRDTSNPHAQPNRRTQSKRRLLVLTGIGGHRLANGLSAPLRC